MLLSAQCIVCSRLLQFFTKSSRWVVTEQVSLVVYELKAATQHVQQACKLAMARLMVLRVKSSHTAPTQSCQGETDEATLVPRYVTRQRKRIKQAHKLFDKQRCDCTEQS